LATRTSANAPVFEIGEPRLQLADGVLTYLSLRVGARRVFAVDGEDTKIWDLATGKLLRRISEPDSDAHSFGLAVSPDGRWLATGPYTKMMVLANPFDTVSFTVDRSAPKTFTPASTKLAVESATPGLVDLAQKQGIATLPKAPATSIVTHAIWSDEAGETMYWIRDVQVLRWTRATNKLEVVYTPPRKLVGAVIPLGGAPIAIVSDGSELQRLDLVTGRMAAIVATKTPFFNVSPSGERVIVKDMQYVRVLDATSGQEIWSAKLTVPPRGVAFAEDENVITYLEGTVVRIVDLVHGPRSYPAPSRFAGWLGAATAAIDRGGTLSQRTLPELDTTPIDATALAARAPQAPAGAPPWATWVTPGPGGDVAAEPSPRHELPFDRRWEAKCLPRLRVWTARGGVRTFKLQRTDEALGIAHNDPCWEIGGGYVVGATRKLVTVYAAATGKQVVKIDVGRPPVDKPQFEHEMWAAAMSPTGEHLALWWRRADVWAPEQPDDPRRDIMHIAESNDPDLIRCDVMMNGDCKQEYFAEVWSLRGTPRRVWQTRFDANRSAARTWPLPKTASGPIAFTHDGKHVLFGFDDGDIVIRTVTDAPATRVEKLHRAPVTRLEVSPDDGWVFSEDRAGEQRIWKLTPP
jgi:WD40 repeat protein